MKKIIYLFSLIALASCTTIQDVGYELSIAEVDKPENHEVTYGVRQKSTLPGSTTTYSAAAFNVSFGKGEGSNIVVCVRNKSAHTIVVDWDCVEYVDITGTVQPTKKVVTAHRIPSGAQAIGKIKTGEKEILLENEPAENLQKKKESYIGKVIKLLIPIEIEGYRNEYLFTLAIDDVDFDLRGFISVRP